MNNRKQLLLQSDRSPGKHNQTVASPHRDIKSQEVFSMNNITRQHYILYLFATLLKVYYKCSGKGCTDIGKTLLKIVYINKTGYFCDSCSQDLLHHHHHTYLIMQKRNAKQGATKIMSDLISELWKRIIQLAQIENRPFLCCKFVPCFELDGGIYSIAYGTIAAVKSHRLEMISDSE